MRVLRPPRGSWPFVSARAMASLPTWNGHYVNDDGQVCARVASGGAEDVNAAVLAARSAFTAWAALQKVLERWQQKKGTAVEWLTKELGCNVKFATQVQVNMVDMHLGSSLKMVDLIKFEERMPMGSLVVKEPVGVVGCITPWNYPLNQIAAKVFPALLVGCTVVLKPSEVTPVCAYLLAEAIHEVRTELGGKSAALLLEDADFQALIPKFVKSLMANTGQSCNALSYEEAVGIAKKVAEATIVGESADSKAIARGGFDVAFTTVMDTMTLEVAEQLLGSSKVTETMPSPKTVDNKMTIAQEEIFGPVLSIIPYSSEEEAIRIANDTVYGLNNAVGSASPERAVQVVGSLDSTRGVNQP
ncbi:Putative aldehyde dehydrogenase SE_1720 [Durusdinium trenchii]|uniref:Aldehyde dehydrogenase SE_1720 n=1 Tax=Durusdinium trenchii TaxID=1381693 RepID=A0ABP0IAV9_9DINO